MSRTYCDECKHFPPPNAWQPSEAEKHLNSLKREKKETQWDFERRQKAEERKFLELKPSADLCLKGCKMNYQPVPFDLMPWECGWGFYRDGCHHVELKEPRH